MANNLYEYYTGQGQALPSVTARAADAAKAGVIGAYTGTAAQNAQLLTYLQKTPVTTSGVNASNVTPSSTYTPPQTTTNTTTVNTAIDQTAAYPGLEAYMAEQAKALEASRAKEIAPTTAADKAFTDMQDYKAGRKDQSTLLSEGNRKYQVDEQYQQITALLPEMTALRTELNNLKNDENQAVENLKGQGRGIPLGVLGAQESKILRTYAIRENAVAANLSAKAATAEALRGNITLANQLVSNSVDAYLYDTAQKVQDYKDLYTYNKDIISKLDAEQKEILDKQFEILKSDYETKKTEQSIIAKTAIQEGVQYTPGMSYADLAARIKANGGTIEYKKMIADGTGANSAIGWLETMQAAIDQGATPEQAAQEAAIASEKLGIPVDQKTLGTWAQFAKTLKPSNSSTQTGDTTTYTGKTKKVPVYSGTDTSTVMYYKDVPDETSPRFDSSTLDFSNLNLNYNPIAKDSATNAMYDQLFGIGK